jgi:peptidoglycan hydrolase CwlO-like protein
MKDKAEMNCRKYQNEIEKGQNQIRELGVRSDRLNEGINEAKQDISENRRVLNECQAENA